MFRSDQCLGSGKAERIAMAIGVGAPEAAATPNGFGGWARIPEFWLGASMA